MRSLDYLQLVINMSNVILLITLWRNNRWCYSRIHKLMVIVRMHILDGMSKEHLIKFTKQVDRELIQRGIIENKYSDNLEKF